MRCNFETVEPFMRSVARQRHKGSDDAANRRRLDQLVRTQTSEALAGELASQPEETADLLAIVLSPGTWGTMRTTQGHTKERAAGLMESAVLRLLGEGASGS